jgi:23S rRNA pseudouridine1911/1915/1917 synthase
MRTDESDRADEPGLAEQGATLTVPESEQGARLLEFLSARFINESKTALRRLVGAGRILLNGRPAPTGEALRAGDVLSLPQGLLAGPPPQQTVPVEVLCEDADHLCVNKPSGWPVLPGRRGEGGEFYRSLVALLNRDAPAGGPYVRPHVVHRLDRETSGVLLVARHVAAGRALSLQFQRRQVEKTYLCIVEGVLPRAEAELNVPLRRKAGSILQMEPATRGGAKAVTYVHLEERFGHFSLLRLRPLTGRQHQIRVHLAAAGYPPLVDGLYGRRERLTGADLNAILGARAAAQREILLDRIPLHAAALRYRPPSAREQRVQDCPLPADMAALLELLRRVDPPRKART